MPYIMSEHKQYEERYNIALYLKTFFREKNDLESIVEAGILQKPRQTAVITNCQIAR